MSDERPRIVLLIGTGWGVRTFLQTDVLPALAERARVSVLAAAGLCDGLRRQFPDLDPAPLAAFDPHRGRFGRFYERHNHHFLWLSRTGTRRINQQLQRRQLRGRKLARWWILRLLAVLGASRRSLERLRRAERTAFFADYPEAARYASLLRRLAPRLVVSTVPHVAVELPPVLVAQDLGIATAAWINSWDNLTSKGAYPAVYDHYLTWSERMLEELRRYYPESAGRPLAAVGVPHFDWYRDEAMCWSRDELCRRLDLDPGRPLVLYATATPQLAPYEHRTVARLARDLAALPERPQLLVRLHPADPGTRFEGLDLGPEVRLQAPGTGAGALHRFCPTAEENRRLVSTIRHADVVVNLASTITLEAAICDRPTINVAYDLGPEPRWGRIIERYYDTFDHYRTVVDLGAVRLARSPRALVAALQHYLAHPESERAARRRLVELWCGEVDGGAGRRLARAIFAAAAVPAGNAAELRSAIAVHGG
ncbi:MAG: hypothetical protein D6696_11920 [Acidobacteria bacterium]|nr:MAG: hypothetical protein D6696_11920 [Acidobacteriota bacterium]